MKFLIKFFSLFSDFFSKAGANGHVFILKNGTTKSKGLAWSGFVGPKSTLAVVPTTPFTIDFSVTAQSSDKQEVRTTGSLVVNFTPAQAVSKFDFTVDVNGAYKDVWQNKVKALVINEVLNPVRAKIKDLTVVGSTIAHSELSTEVMTASAVENNLFSVNGMTVVSCSITNIETTNDEVSDAIGAKERQEICTAADKAVHERQMAAATNDRSLKEYEVETLKSVEVKNAELIEQKNKNKESTANGDAKVVELMLVPYANLEAGKLLAHAILKIGENGRIGTLNISPELLALLKDAAK